MSDTQPRRRIFWVWWVASLVWMGTVAYRCVTTWPHISMDLAAKDPEVVQAHYEAIGVHIGWHVAIGLLPVLIVFAILCLIVRRRSKA